MPFVDFHSPGSVGIIRDIPPHELPPEAWSNGRNMRFRDGKCEQAQGYVNVNASICASPTYCIAVPRQTTTSDIWVYCGERDVYAFDGSTNAKLTASAISATGQNTWNATLLSGILVVNPTTTKPKYWVFPPNTATTLTDLPDWSASWTTKVIRSYKNYLVALNTTEKDVAYPYRVRWSHAADAGAVPASWTPSSTNDAGFNDIIEGGDFVVDGAPLGDQFMIYKEQSTWSMRYIGGQLIHSFQQVYPDVGCISKNAIATLGRRHFVVSQNDIYLHDGYSDPVPLLNSRLKSFFYSDISRSQTDKTFVVPNHPRKEIWVFYADASSGQISKALIWNYAQNTWSVKDCPTVVGGNFGGFEYIDDLTTWDGTPGTWDSSFGTWNAEDYYREGRVMLVNRSDQQLILADQGYQDRGSNYSSYLERRAIPLFGQDRGGNPKSQHNALKYVRGVWPRMTLRKSGTVNIYVGYQNDPLDAPVYSGPYAFNPQTMQKIDCRVTGRWIAVKFECTGNLGWALDSFSLDVDPVGTY